ncbi:MAG: peptidoglycan-binding domain-containing protein, partial [Actinomycetota bacterium]
MADQTGSSRRRRNLALAVVATAVVSAGVGIVVGRSLQSPADAAAAAKAPEPSRITVPVERRTLVSRLIANGDVQYTEPTPLRLAGAVGASAGSAQVVTKVPALDQALAEGDVVMEVSGRPIFVFQGDLPTYRGLEPGSSGHDVRQLEEALLRLGTFIGTPDDRYDDGTESAIDALYDRKGYKSEGPSDDQRARLRTAEKAVADSNKALNSARQELAKGRAGLTGSGLLAAQQQLQGARDAVPTAEAAAVRSNADATAGVVTATALRDGAMKARNAAKALRDAAIV